LEIYNIFKLVASEDYRKKAKVRLLFKTVFDCRQKISIREELE
jgi:hypothetical protein